MGAEVPGAPRPSLSFGAGPGWAAPRVAQHTEQIPTRPGSWSPLGSLTSPSSTPGGGQGLALHLQGVSTHTYAGHWGGSVHLILQRGPRSTVPAGSQAAQHARVVRAQGRRLQMGGSAQRPAHPFQGSREATPLFAQAFPKADSSNQPDLPDTSQPVLYLLYGFHRVTQSLLSLLRPRAASASHTTASLSQGRGARSVLGWLRATSPV